MPASVKSRAFVLYMAVTEYRSISLFCRFFHSCFFNVFLVSLLLGSIVCCLQHTQTICLYLLYTANVGHRPYIYDRRSVYVFCAELLLNAPMVDGCRVFGGILHVLFVGAGEVVRAAEVFFGAHIQVIVVLHIEHCIDACYRRNAYRAGR